MENVHGSARHLGFILGLHNTLAYIPKNSLRLPGVVSAAFRYSSYCSGVKHCIGLYDTLHTIHKLIYNPAPIPLKCIAAVI